MKRFFNQGNPIIVGLSSNLLGSAVMFFTTIYLTRTFPIDVYGQFRLIFAFIALVVIFLQFGRDNGIIYYGQHVEDSQARHQLIRAEVLFGWIGLSIGALLLYVFTPQILTILFSENIDVSYFQLSLLMIPLWGGFNLLIAAIKTQGMINQSFLLANLAQRVLRLPFLLMLSLLSVSYYSLALGMILSQLCLVILAWRTLQLRYTFADIRLLSDFFKRFIYALQLGINTIIFILLSKIDIIMLGKLVGDKAVAVYDTVVLLAFVVTLPFVALVKASEVVMQALVRDEKEQQRYKLNLKLSIHLSMAVVLFILIAPKDILHIFGVEYIVGYRALMIMAVGYLLLCLLGTPIELLNMNGRGKISAVILIATVGLNILLNIILIPRYGLEGAAIATMVSLMTSKLLGLVIVRWHYPGLSLAQLRPTLMFFVFILGLALGSLKEFEYWIFNLAFSMSIVFCYVMIFIGGQPTIKEKIHDYFTK